MISTYYLEKLGSEGIIVEFFQQKKKNPFRALLGVTRRDENNLESRTICRCPGWPRFRCSAGAGVGRDGAYLYTKSPKCAVFSSGFSSRRRYFLDVWPNFFTKIWGPLDFARRVDAGTFFFQSGNFFPEQIRRTCQYLVEHKLEIRGAGSQAEHGGVCLGDMGRASDFFQLGERAH